LLHQRDGVEVLLRDERDRNVVDADLVLLDEVQQQIERSLERLELDRKRVWRRLELGMRMVHLSVSVRDLHRLANALHRLRGDGAAWCARGWCARARCHRTGSR